MGAMDRPDPDSGGAAPDDGALVDRLARLARIRLTSEERALLATQIRRILDSMALLEAAVPPPAAPRGGAVADGVLRADAVEDSLPRARLLQGTAGARDGFIEVPPVLDPGEGD